MIITEDLSKHGVTTKLISTDKFIVGEIKIHLFQQFDTAKTGLVDKYQ